MAGMLDLNALSQSVRGHMKPEPKKKKNPEQQLQNKILTYLNRHPLVAKAWRQNSGKIKTQHGTWFTGAPSGTSDIIGFLADGRFLAIEVKVGSNKPTDNETRGTGIVR